MGCVQNRRLRAARLLRGCPALVLVLAVLSMLLVAGCGSSSKTSSATAQASSSTTSTAPASTSTSTSSSSTSTASSAAKRKGAKQGTSSTTSTNSPSNGSASGRTPLNPLRQILGARPRDPFESQLNNLCSRGNKATLPFVRRYRQAFLSRNYALLASLREQALRSYLAVANPTSLTAPASHQAAFKRYVVASQSFVKLNQQIDTALATHNLAGVQKLQQQVVAAGTARAQSAVALGARACAI